MKFLDEAIALDDFTDPEGNGIELKGPVAR